MQDEAKQHMLGYLLLPGRNREAIRGHATHVLSKECNLADELPDVIYAQRLTALEYYGNLASFCGCLNDNPGGLMVRFSHPPFVGGMPELHHLPCLHDLALVSNSLLNSTLRSWTEGYRFN